MLERPVVACCLFLLYPRFPLFGDDVVRVSGTGSGRATDVLRKPTMPLGCVPLLLRPDAQIRYAMRRRVARP